jgi:UDP-glucose 4-epimerase
MRKKALVTGGLGFIGSHVAELLCEKNLEVLVVDDLSTGNELNQMRDVSYFLGSLGHPKVDLEILSFSPDYIFHLAALPRIQPSFEYPIQYNQANINATVELLELARQIKVEAFIYSSSASVYGNPDKQPITERTSISPLNPYAVQKYAGEQLALLLGEKWEVPVVALRYFNPFGERSYHPNNKDSAYSPVVGIFESCFQLGQKMKITGDGSQRRDFVYVKDVAWANLLSALKIEIANQNTFNVCSGSTQSILEIAQMFESPYEFISARMGEAEISWGCNCKISEMLEWKPTLTVQEYISRFSRPKT